MLFRADQLDMFHERPKPARSILLRLLSRPRQLRAQQLEPLFCAMEPVAETHGATIAQVALNWLRVADPCVIPIPAVKSVDQMRANAAALGWQMAQSERDLISRAEESTQ